MQKRNGMAEHPKARILVVDDHEPSAKTLERILGKAGYENVRATSDPRRVLVMLSEAQPDLLVLDIRMPDLDGFAILRQIRARHGDARIPVLIITGDTDRNVKEQALSSGANDFLLKPFDAIEIVLRVRNLLKVRFLAAALEERVEERTAALKRSELELAQRLALAAELRDYKSGDHTQRVGHSSARVARALGLPDDEVESIRVCAPLHDIGKIAIPDRIVLKTGALTLEEFEVVKGHTTFGARILAGSSSPLLQRAEEIALYHHENWDGTGYTPGISGDAIPLAARIVRVADVYDALVHDRPYKKAWSPEEAMDLITDGAGSTFDPDVVDAFVKVQSTEGLPLLADELPDLDDTGLHLASLMHPFEPIEEQPAILGTA